MMQRSNTLNAHMSAALVEKACKLTRADASLLDNAMTKLGLSARGYFKIPKVTRTIADLEGAECIGTVHLTEALGFHRLDRAGYPSGI
ncbi:MAG: hypothetical protein CMQ19_02485 [Gammaproteobacteria bacterium]|nr:hypothetical protein [Gammaproteobacteria bacterium]|tara:strand:- start:2976 stop:3239 length:264 start_codon:yes stop_codon:yes gene_type:complete